MRGLNTLGWRNLRRRKVRYALTALGIVLGVANVFGVFVANATTNRGLEEGSRSFFGSADVIAFPDVDEPRATADPRTRIPPLPPTFSEAALTKLREVDGVEAVAPRSPAYAPLVRKGRALVPAEPEEESNAVIYIGGFDVVGARRERTLERGRFFGVGAPEVIVTTEAARRLDRDIGDTIEVRMTRPVRLEIVGIYVHPTLRGYSEALADRGIVNQIFGTKDASAAFVYLKPGIEPDVWAVEHETALPELRLVPSRLPADFREFLDVIQASLTGAATIALFVGAFLIYLTFTMTVVERTRLYGTLHAVGATEGQVRRAVLTEALTLGTAATIFGLLVGLGLAAGLVRVMARVVETERAPLTVPTGALVAGLSVGLLATLAGALMPALRAGRISPVEAIRGSLLPKPRASRVWIAGILSVAVGAALHWLRLGREPRLGALTWSPTLFLLLGAVLLVPTLVPPLARAIRLLARRLSPGLGEVAVMHLVRERTRSAYTLGLVMVVLAMILTLAAAHASLGGVVDRWVETRFGADLLVYGDEFADDTPRRIADIEGVRALTVVTFDRVRVVRPDVGRVQNLVVIDPSTFFDVAGFPWADGDDTTARRALERGGGVLLPATSATRLGLRRGDVVTLQTRDGPHDFVLTGTYASIAAGPEVGFVAGIRDGRALFDLQEPNVLYVSFEPTASPPETTRAVEGALDLAAVPEEVRGEMVRVEGDSGGYSLGSYFFITGSAIKAQARRALNSYMSLFLAVLLVGMLVGLLGLANTLATSVLHRYREIGTLQAVGASPNDVRRMILVESGALVAAALLLSIALGTALGRIVLGGGNALLGFSPPYIFPWGWVPALAVLAVVVALTAAIAPARRAARLTPIEALRYE